MEERVKYEERLEELSKQMREYLNLGDLEKACELRGEALGLIEFLGREEEFEELLAQLRKKAREQRKKELAKLQKP